MSGKQLVKEHFLLITGSSVTPYRETPSDSHLAVLHGHLMKGARENLF
jgi:hypothetical protein